MDSNKQTKPAQEKAGKGTSTDKKTNQDFNGKTPKQDDPQLKIKKVKK